MLMRQCVVWLFALAILLGIPAAGARANFAHGPALLDSHHSVSLLPFSEPSLHSLRPQPDNDVLPPPKAPKLTALYSVTTLQFGDAIPRAPLSLCRDFPSGQSPPLFG